MTQKVKSWKGPSRVFPASLTFFFSNLIFIYFWLCWVFIAVRALLLWQVEDPLRFWGTGFSFRWLLGTEHGLQSTGSEIVVRGLNYSVACGIFPDQASNPFLLY